MRVVVRAPARIHVGIIDLDGGLGRLYGSVGLAVDQPATVVVAENAPELVVEGERAARAREFAQAAIRAFGLDRGARVRVLSAAPEHVGLGSGTQLALGVGLALAKLNGLDIPAEELAEALGRGEVSGAGTYAFKLGGLVVDGGKRPGGGLPPLVARVEIPRRWRFVIGLPGRGRGLYGDAERRAMERVVGRCGAALPATAARIVLMKLLPAAAEGDIHSFGEAVNMLEQVVGRMFSAVQGGVFRDPVVEEGVSEMLRAGAAGAGQSSWGPAFYGVVEGDEDAEAVARRVEAVLRKHGGGRALIARPNNRGASVEVG